MRAAPVETMDRVGPRDVFVTILERGGVPSGEMRVGPPQLEAVGPRPPPPRTLYAAPAAIGEVAFSPDATMVLAARPGAAEWMLLPVGRGRARAIGGIARHFDPRRARGMPKIGGWTR